MARSEAERRLGPARAPARLFVWPFEMMLRLQANMVNAMRESTGSWIGRRQEAADDAVETFERLIYCQDVGEALAIQQEWLEGTMRRVNDDIEGFAKQGAALSHEAASSAQEAGTRSFHNARAAMRQAGESVQAGREPEHAGAEGKNGTAHRTSRRRGRAHHRA